MVGSSYPWQRANQLYLPEGPGRPSEELLDKIYTGYKIIPVPGLKLEIKVLLFGPLKQVTSAALSLLRKYYKIETIEYKNEQDYRDNFKSRKFDLRFVANDFSSIDLRENLKVALNQNEPYILLGKNEHLKRLMKLIVNESDEKIRHQKYSELDLELLDDGLVIPLAYRRVRFYHTENLDISGWSKLFPEISFWKSAWEPLK